MKRLQVSSKRGTSRKVIAIRADQILNQNTSTLTSRGPNILKRSAVDNKAGKLFISPISNTTTIPTITEPRNFSSTSEVKLLMYFKYNTNIYKRYTGTINVGISHISE